MNRKSAPAIPEAILQLQRQLNQFRSIPSAPDEAAGVTAEVELARPHA
jgi:hypothetical protein